jgi:formylglycine-generating enzyme
MKRSPCINSLLAVVVAAVICQQAHSISIPTVEIGNPGNFEDTRYFSGFGIGTVDHNFRIGKYEVTNVQYVEFLNSVDPDGINELGLYSSSMTTDPNGGVALSSGNSSSTKYSTKPGRGNNPVIYVSWYDAIRFTNWLHNGQAAGDTEDGAYKISERSEYPSNGFSIVRNVDARWWLPSDNEWYKAAYHKNDGATGNYWDYATATNVIPDNDQPPGADAPNASNVANFYRDDGVANGYNDGYAATGSTHFNSLQNYLTDVGAYASAASAYGTFDQNGNVYEWDEFQIAGIYRGIRGGVFSQSLETAWLLNVADPYGGPGVGFRVATISIPEPTNIGFLASWLSFVLLRRR